MDFEAVCRTEGADLGKLGSRACGIEGFRGLRSVSDVEIWPQELRDIKPHGLGFRV